jgi:hypothetical protein
LTGQGAYDSPSGDDAYVQVVNNTGSSVQSFALSGANIFGFDGDGFDNTINGIPGAPGNATDNSAANIAAGLAGYGGANVYFTVTDANDGTVNFITALADGGVDYFSLEGNPNGVAAALGPIPASWTMLLIGFAGLGFMGYRASRKSSQVIAAA